MSTPKKGTVNWGAPEATTRLLSAVIAAHPELKLNYAATAAAFGTPCTESAIRGRWERVLSKDVKAIKSALKAGVDPATLTLNGAVGNELSKAYGSPSTAGGIEYQFRGLRKNAKQLRKAMDDGVDTIEVILELAKAYGPPTTAGGLRFQVDTRWKPQAKRLRSAMDDGVCTSTVNLAENEVARLYGCTVPAISWQWSQRFKPMAKELLESVNAGAPVVLGQTISKHYGGYCTTSSAENKFRKIKTDAVSFREAVEAGQDPSLLPMLSCGGRTAEIASYMEGATQYSLQHKFRDIVKEAKNLRAETMSKFVPEFTPSSLEHRFRPLRKLAKEWVAAGTGGGEAATPKKRGGGGKGAKTTPKSKATAADDDEETLSGLGEDEATPAKKKVVLNRVKNGRVSKKVSPKKKADGIDITKVKAEMIDEDDDQYHSASQGVGAEATGFEENYEEFE